MEEEDHSEPRLDKVLVPWTKAFWSHPQLCLKIKDEILKVGYRKLSPPFSSTTLAAIKGRS